MLVKIENDMCVEQIKLKQHQTTTYNLEKQIKELTTDLNHQDVYISSLESELKKLYSDIQMKSMMIESELKELESLKKKHEASQQYLVINIFNIIY